jgi:LysM repeat protein
LLRGIILMEDLSASIEPEMVIVMTPIVEDSVGEEGNASDVAAAPAESIIVSDTQAVALVAAESLVTPLPADPLPAGDEAQSQEMSILAAAQESSSGVGGPSPTETTVSTLVEESVSATATSLPTNAPTPTVTPQPPTPIPTTEPVAPKGMAATLVTEEPAQTATPTWTVQSPSSERNAASGVAAASSAALAVSDTTSATVTPTVASTPAPTPTATPVVYQVRTGDTLVSIASRYDVDVDELMEANEIGAQDVYALQPGQMLYIPVAVELPAPAANPGTMRLEAPVLLVPTNEATVGCETGGKLIWQQVQFVKDSDKYVLHLGFVVGQSSDGPEEVVWILAQSGPVTQTEWELDTTLCDLAPAESDHQWRWWVEVVEEVDERTMPVSPPSVTRSFVWK